MLRSIFVYLVIITTCHGFNPIPKTLNYSKRYEFSLNKDVEYILEFDNVETPFSPPRITVECEDATVMAPLMVVARQPKELLSWQLPLVVESSSGDKLFHNLSKTLCHDIVKGRKWIVEGGLVKHDSPVVTVSTASLENITFNILLEHQDDFYINVSVPYELTISPSEPRYYFYSFPKNVRVEKYSNYDTVILEVTSDDSVCMTVSIQNVSCPVFDSNQDITYRGFYETVSKKGGITIPKYKFPYGFYLVFLAKGDDEDCTGRVGMSEVDRQKHISFIIKPSITYEDYVFAVVMTLVSILAFYVLFGIAYFICSRRLYRPKEMSQIDGYNNTTTATAGECTIAASVVTVVRGVTAVVKLDGDIPLDGAGGATGGPGSTGRDSGDAVSLNEAEYDIVEEVDRDREIRLGKSVVYLCDLARKDPIVIMRKSYLYLYNVLTVAIFYGLPVIQLVIAYQNVLNETGQQDLCYYNFLCAHPLGFISDFNHLFSNVGYVLFGVLFLIIVNRRSTTHNDMVFERRYGIPQHYGLFYAMGVSLIMEGVLSGSYHICPNTTNFQFDSSFMYVMAVLCMVKLYQNRHPDINATAYATFGVLAIAIFLGLIGILESNIYFWSTFTVIHLVTCLYLSAQIYYMGCWKLDRGLVMRIYRVTIYDLQSGIVNVIRPTYKARMVLLIIGNLCNWGVATAGLIYHQKGFALYLLGIFMMNTLLYFFFYILMKIIHKERVNCLPICFLVIAIVCAISAMWFFLHRSISWVKTPAESRLFNQECKLLRFYDYHDIWHFLSAIGMFFTFMVLLTLDDDLSHTSRSEIRVF